MNAEHNVTEAQVKAQDTEAMSEFRELINDVAQLSEAEQKNICFFVNGYMAAAAIERTA